jgi:hypothetical protein
MTMGGGVTVVPNDLMSAIERTPVTRPWWQRWAGLVYRPWRKPRIVETSPWYQIGNTVYAHPDNVAYLREAIEERNEP